MRHLASVMQPLADPLPGSMELTTHIRVSDPEALPELTNVPALEVEAQDEFSWRRGERFNRLSETLKVNVERRVDTSRIASVLVDKNVIDQ
jgi:hypothetical protein